jgi:uncharacterized protein (DUF1800 family)
LLFSFGFGISSECWAGKFPAANSREVNAIRNQIRAAQFLSHATFGPTQKMIDDLAGRMGQVGYRRACEEWIDQQFALPATSHVQVARDIFTADGRQEDTQDVGMQLYRYQAWWHIALTADDQLRQRAAWALAQIFVISDSGTNFNNDDRRSKGNGEMTIADWMGMSDYYDMLAGHVTGNYRELLGDVTFHECMGVYLSSWRNQKANVTAGRFPDENYAREIMQLFSIGLYKLRQDGRLEVDANGNLIPTYDNDGITELARLFTGFRSFHNTSTSFTTGTNFGDPMEMYFLEHDNNRNYREDPNTPGVPDPNAPLSKTLFGVTLSPLPVPLTKEAALAEVNEGLDVIANHDNVPPFICRLMIQRLVKSNPSRGYLRRVTRAFRDNGQGQRGDFKAVIKAILLDPEAVRGQRLVRRQNPLAVEVVTLGTEHSRLKEPVQRITSLIRALRPRSTYPYSSSSNPTLKVDPSTGSPFMMLSNSIETDLGQLPFDAPSVFNYYLPDYQPPGDLIGYTPSRQIPREALFAPEFQVMTAVTANRMINQLASIARNRYVAYGMRVGTCRIDLDLSEEIELARNNANLPEILRRFDLLLCNGSLSEQSKSQIISAITSESTASNQNVERLEEALLAVLISPDCAVED